MSKYDFAVIGAGLFGATFAYEACKRGKKVLVLDRRDHIGGNCYTRELESIHVHAYGPHCFHTAHKPLWDYVSQFAEFNNFSLRGKANYQGRLYSMPLNLMTMQQVWRVSTPQEALAKLESVKIPCKNPRNLEDFILSEVGHELYEMFIKGYTAKQWGREPRELPKSIIQRLPIRTHFNDRWFKDEHRWEGIPIGGYTAIFERMLRQCEVKLNVDFLLDRSSITSLADRVVYTGPLDEYFDHCYGRLEYRSLRFEEEVLNGDFQGTAIVNYTEQAIPWTRIVEHKHFEFKQDLPKTVITREYPAPYTGSNPPFYPVRDEVNVKLYSQYAGLAARESTIFGGRLARYQYFDMDQTIANALSVVRSALDS